MDLLSTMEIGVNIAASIPEPILQIAIISSFEEETTEGRVALEETTTVSGGRIILETDRWMVKIISTLNITLVRAKWVMEHMETSEVENM